MSKKTRKKSPKSPTGKTIGVPSRAKGGGPSSQSRGHTATATSKSTKSGQARTGSKASHETPSKRLRSAAPARRSHPSSGKAAAKAAGSAIAEGTQAPSFHLPRDGGSSVSLADYAGKKLVVFFYPRADTPGCTKEAIDFTRLTKAFGQCNTAVLGVSGDSLGAQEAFRNKHHLGVPLASDEKHEMLAAYGAWGEKSMYGRTFQGILRTTVLIGKNSQILKIWRHVRVEGHAEEVLAAACAV